ncbi:hypothetical protein D3C77_579850 [compost metagenome]
MKQQARCDISPIRVSYSNIFAPIKPIFHGRLIEKIIQLPSPQRQILLIKHAFGQPAKKTGHPVFKHIPANTENRRVRRQSRSKRQQIALRSSRTMQEH